MFDVRSSANAAVLFFKSLYPDAQDNGILVEEVELSENGKSWFVTLGYNVRVRREERSWNELLALTPEKVFVVRDYKTFEIDRETGEVKSMKIRKV